MLIRVDNELREETRPAIPCMTVDAVDIEFRVWVVLYSEDV